jgi:hypothetical protein
VTENRRHYVALRGLRGARWDRSWSGCSRCPLCDSCPRCSLKLFRSSETPLVLLFSAGTLTLASCFLPQRYGSGEPSASDAVRPNVVAVARSSGRSYAALQPARVLHSLALANIAFFGLSQLVEGVPIASGDWCLGLVAAILGSLVSALFVFVFGGSVIYRGTRSDPRFAAPKHTDPQPQSEPLRIAPRRASAAFSLFVPNRPPPTPFLA